jgi:hypothetical protein
MPYWFIYSLILWTYCSQRWASTMEKSELEKVSDSRDIDNQLTTSNNRHLTTMQGTITISDIRQISNGTRQPTPDRRQKTTNTDSQIRKFIKTDVRRQPTANNCCKIKPIYLFHFVKNIFEYVQYNQYASTLSYKSSK